MIAVGDFEECGMAVPKYDEMMLPVLKRLGDERDFEPLTSKQIREHVALHFALGEDERAEQIPSGFARYANNAQWACTYLKQAGLIASPKRGSFRITERGRSLLAEGVGKIDRQMLLRYPEFREFLSRGGRKGDAASREPLKGGAADADGGVAPEDALEASFGSINAALASELLDAVVQQTPEFFERLVVDLLLAMGYGDAKAGSGTTTKRTDDEGIDGVVREDKLGFSSIYVQAKRWAVDRSVGRPELRAFVGALTGAGASKGLFITTASFSSKAREYAEKQHAVSLVLVDGGEFAQLMIAHDVGVSVRRRYEIKGLDRDYFDAGL